MKPGIYKHRSCTDTAMLVLKSEVLENGYKVLVHWLNVVNPNHIFKCFETPNYELVSFKEFPNWEKYEIPE